MPRPLILGKWLRCADRCPGRCGVRHNAALRRARRARLAG
jgi:hypothetical protein